MTLDLRALGVGLSDLGASCTWREAMTLMDAFAADPSYHLGAELGGWRYPASRIELLQMAHYAGERAPYPWLEPARPTRDEIDEGARVLARYSAIKE